MINKLKHLVISLMASLIIKLFPKKYYFLLIKLLLAHLKNNSSKNDNLVENVFRFDNWFYKFENSIALLHGGCSPQA